MEEDVKTVVNCSGLGFGDPKSDIIRCEFSSPLSTSYLSTRSTS